MDDKHLNKLILQGVMVIIVYYIISNLIVYIVWGVIGMVAFRIYQDHHKRK